MLAGRIDFANRDTVTGWAADDASPEESLPVILLVDDQVRQRTIADSLRQDLRDLGRYGGGLHGFTFSLASPLSAGHDHRIEVRIGSEGGFPVAPGPIPLWAASAVRGPERARSSPRFVIHVGPHKTGTKYLQHSLTRNRLWLEAHGVLYPDLWAVADVPAHTELAALIGRQAHGVRTKFDQLRDSGFPTILLSSEDLSDQSETAFRYLADLISPSSVSVVFYCRRWSELLFSGWQETVKQGHTMPFPEFCAHHLANQQGSTIINFGMVLDRLAAAFGLDGVSIVSYSHLADDGQDILRHFTSEILGINEALEPQQRMNESMSLFDAELLRVVNALGTGFPAAPRGYLYQQFVERREQIQLTAVLESMEDSISNLWINEAAPGLSTIHEAIARKYSVRMVNPKLGDFLFQPVNRPIRFVGSSYLLKDGVIDQLKGVHVQLIKSALA